MKPKTLLVLAVSTLFVLNGASTYGDNYRRGSTPSKQAVFLNSTPLENRTINSVKSSKSEKNKCDLSDSPLFGGCLKVNYKPIECENNTLHLKDVQCLRGKTYIEVGEYFSQPIVGDYFFEGAKSVKWQGKISKEFIKSLRTIYSKQEKFLLIDLTHLVKRFVSHNLTVTVPTLTTSFKYLSPNEFYFFVTGTVEGEQGGTYYPFNVNLWGELENEDTLTVRLYGGMFSHLAVEMEGKITNLEKAVIFLKTFGEETLTDEKLRRIFLFHLLGAKPVKLYLKVTIGDRGLELAKKSTEYKELLNDLSKLENATDVNQALLAHDLKELLSGKRDSLIVTITPKKEITFADLVQLMMFAPNLEEKELFRILSRYFKVEYKVK